MIYGHSSPAWNWRVTASAGRHARPSPDRGKSCHTTPACISLQILFPATTRSDARYTVLPGGSAAASRHSVEFGQRRPEIQAPLLPVPPKSFENQGLWSGWAGRGHLESDKPTFPGRERQLLSRESGSGLNPTYI